MKTVTRKKKDIKRTFYGLGTFMAVLLSVALVLTSFDFTVLIVRAEESADSGQETGEEPRYVTNDAGAIIINGFQPLGSIEQIELDQKGTLEEVTDRMPSQIWVSVTKEEPEQPPESSSEESSGQPSDSSSEEGGESQPDNSDQSSDSSSEEGGESQTESSEQPSEGSSEEGGASQPDSSEQPSEGSSEEDGESQPDGSEQPSEGSSEEGGASQPDSSGQPSESSSGENGGTQAGDDSQEQNPEENGSGDEEPGTGDASSEEPQQAPEKDRRDRQWTTAWRQDTGIRVNIELLSEGGIILPDSSEEPFSEPAEENSSELTEENLSEPTEENSSESTEENPSKPTEGNSSESTEGNPSKPTEGNSSESTEENPSKPTEGNPSESTEENPSESTEENPSESTEENPSESMVENPSESTEENPSEPTEENPPTIRYKRENVFISIDVTWECTVDYENTELASYTFQPVWDEKKYDYEGDKSNIPTITVTISPKVNGVKVHNQEELQTALDNRAERIVMMDNISLTSSLRVPAFTDIVLDGGNHSLLRGDTDGVKFTGAMLVVEGADEGEENGEETFTLTNIHVNGRTDESDDNNMAGAPAIIVFGNLILDEGAHVEGNKNCGTVDDQGEFTVKPIGGGLLVYGRLRIREGAVVENNFAADFGGGVYLEDGAGLYLHADVIWNNYAVGDRKNAGKDLYASAGSFVSYVPSINLKNKTGEGSYYIAPDAKVYELGPDKPPVVDPPEIVEGNVEVFLSIHRDSGYSDEEIARLTSALKEKGITVITPGRTDIDTTDLRNWYVYDHYEPLQWGGNYNDTVAPQAWQDVYGGNPKRLYYGYIQNSAYYLSNPANGNPVNTIAEWLERQDDYVFGGRLCLAQFKEHIYTRNQNGRPEMTFVGYGHPAYVDFLYYDPESDGEKVVNFDVNSADVFTHTLQGTGFLVNAGVDDSRTLHGYLVYYTYTDNTYTMQPTQADCLYICDISGMNAINLHQRATASDASFNFLDSGRVLVQQRISDIGGWKDDMSIQIVTTPESIIIRQQPKDAEGSIDKTDPVLEYSIPEEKRDSSYSGFGPLVAYTDQGHTCNRASAFTYSNLRMYFTNPVLERGDMLTPLQEADYTQAGDQRYFLNIFGDSQLEYNDTADFGQYQELLYIMQSEGVALITDRESPFESYLGEAPEGNLCEVKPGSGSRLSIDELVNQVVTYVANKESTALNVEEDRLTEAAPKQSVGNISLWSMNGSQIRSFKVPAEGYAIHINDMSYRLDEAEPSYSILKPGAPGYAALDINPFIVTNDEKEWPAGEYTIRQRYPASSIYGYSYFTLMKDSPASQPTVTPEKPVFQRPSVSYEGEASEEFVQMEAPGNPAVPSGPDEPKTGDRRLPPMPVAMGACTMFMLKLLLWMYEMEMGITDQVKDEMLQTLIDWAKGTTKPRIYLALMAISVVLVIYHMFKEMNAKRKRMAVKRREK